MTHTPHIKQLLDELYQIEPELRHQESQLQKVVALMAAKKPEVNIPENFKKTLERRLISGINPDGRERRVHKQNSYFRFFWYFIGAGVCASIALSFGFFDFLQPSSVQNTKPLMVLSDTDAGPDSPLKTPIHSPQAENNSPLSMNRSVVPDISPVPEKMAKKTPSVVQKKTDSPRLEISNNETLAVKTPESLPLAMNLVTENSGTTSSMSQKKGNSVIAYVGEILAVDSLTRENNSEMSTSKTSDVMMTQPLTDSNITTMDSMSGDRFGVGMGEGSGSDQQQITSTGITFATIISRAQTEANLVIPENDRSFYTLSTPHITYVSRDNSHTKDTVELIQVYIFPLVRTDGKESTIKEIQVEVP